MDTGILISILGIVATILFGIVGVLAIRNRLSQRQRVTGGHSSAFQSGRDTVVDWRQGGNVENALGSTIIFNNTTLDANSDEFARPLISAIAMTILLLGTSIFYLWEQSAPIELQHTFLLQLAIPAIGFLLVIVSVLWIWLFLKTHY